MSSISNDSVEIFGYYMRLFYSFESVCVCVCVWGGGGGGGGGGDLLINFPWAWRRALMTPEIYVVGCHNNNKFKWVVVNFLGDQYIIWSHQKPLDIFKMPISSQTNLMCRLAQI